MQRNHVLLLTGFMLSAFLLGGAVQAKPPKDGGGKAAPDIANGKYGPNARNVFDFWKSKAKEPAPLMIFIHGGGWRTGGKGQIVPEILSGCQAAGWNVASIEYRFAATAPFPAPFHDCARAVQYFRSKAKELNIDPTRIALSGNSAGGCMSLWIGFHDDLANPNSPDPVLRQSTRVSCMYVINAQTTTDPVELAKYVDDEASNYFAKHKLYNGGDRKLIEEGSPLKHVSAGDPPVFLIYNKGTKGVHSSLFAKPLKAKMDALKIECNVANRQGEAMMQFLNKYLKEKK